MFTCRTPPCFVALIPDPLKQYYTPETYAYLIEKGYDKHMLVVNTPSMYGPKTGRPGKDDVPGRTPGDSPEAVSFSTCTQHRTHMRIN